MFLVRLSLGGNNLSSLYYVRFGSGVAAKSRSLSLIAIMPFNPTILLQYEILVSLDAKTIQNFKPTPSTSATIHLTGDSRTQLSTLSHHHGNHFHSNHQLPIHAITSIHISLLSPPAIQSPVRRRRSCSPHPHKRDPESRIASSWHLNKRLSTYLSFI